MPHQDPLSMHATLALHIVCGSFAFVLAPGLRMDGFSRGHGRPVAALGRGPVGAATAIGVPAIAITSAYYKRKFTPRPVAATPGAVA